MGGSCLVKRELVLPGDIKGDVHGRFEWKSETRASSRRISEH